MVYSLNDSSIYEQIKNELNHVTFKEEYWIKINLVGLKIPKKDLVAVDD